MLIKNVTIVPMLGEDIPLGYVQTAQTKISAFGPMSALGDCTDAETYDMSGYTLYPGFVDAHCHLGMWEDGLGFEGDDGNEMTDPITPNLRAIDAINPVNISFDEAVSAGVTTIVTGPGSSNPIAGQFCAMKTYGKRVDSMLIKAPIAMKFALGENPKGCYHEKAEQPTTRMSIAAVIREALYKAKRYLEDLDLAQADDELDPPDYDAKSEALCDVLRGKLKAHFHCHRADDIFTAVRLAEEFHLDYVLVHCTEGHMVAEELAEINAKIICGPYICTRSKPELRNLTAKTPAILQKAGLQVAICSDYNVIPIDFLPATAAVAVREGMAHRQALLALTLNPARICGIEDRVGSIEVGKDADMILFVGDPLSIYEKPAFVFVNGKKVSGDYTEKPAYI